MAYTISTAFAIYFVLWWVVLFLTLPFGVRSQHEDGAGVPGTDPGAPIATQMGRKLIWTTVISAAIFAVAWLAYFGETSPIAKFLERNIDGGIHHICYDVPDIIAARDTLIKEGARVLGDGVPKIGAHGKPVLFLHPKDFSGALVEIEQA